VAYQWVWKQNSLSPFTPAMPVLPTPEQKEEIVQLLPLCIPGYSVDPTNTDQLVSDAMRCADPVHKRCSMLLNDLNDPRRINEPPSDLQSFLGDHYRKDDPIELDPQRASNEQSSRLRDSLQILREYKNVRDLLDQIAEDQAGDEVFRDHLNQLKEALNSMK
jgi:hypothetical protein